MSYEIIRYSQIPKIKGTGKPKKFESVEELEEKIQAYFNSCFMEKTERIKVRNEEDNGYEYVDSVAKDRDGNVIYVQIRPFTVTGLALYLDTNRQTLLNYEKDPANAEYFDTIKKAKETIQNYAEEFLFSGKNVVGAIFNLKNNWGYVDRIENTNLNANVDVDDDKVKTKVNSMFDD